MFFGKERELDLSYKVEQELIYNGVSVLLIREDTNMGTAYQVIHCYGIELTTFDGIEANKTFTKFANKILNIYKENNVGG
jgi:hypothetical protein